FRAKVPAAAERNTLSLHDALPIFAVGRHRVEGRLLSQPVIDPRAVIAARRGEDVALNAQLLGDLGQPDGGLMIDLVGQLRVQVRSEEHTSELQSRENLVCRLLLEK